MRILVALSSLLVLAGLGTALAELAGVAPGVTAGRHAVSEAVSPERGEPPPEAGALRVCADPNNLPFSNQQEEGFENRLAELVAEELGGVPVEYTWWAQRRGFIRNTLRAGRCDVVMGVPTGYGMTTTTRPYYRSTYVFLSREADGLEIRSLDDPALRSLRVGVHTIGDDYANTPGAHALGKRDIHDNVVGFRIFGDYSKPNPPARLVEAVADGRVDVAIVWGPFAGYFGKRLPVAMHLEPVTPPFDPPNQAFVYSISMGVRRGDYALRSRLNQIIERRREDIEKILDAYDIPRLPLRAARRGGGKP